MEWHSDHLHFHEIARALETTKLQEELEDNTDQIYVHHKDQIKHRKLLAPIVRSFEQVIYDLEKTDMGDCTYPFDKESIVEFLTKIQKQSTFALSQIKKRSSLHETDPLVFNERTFTNDAEFIDYAIEMNLPVEIYYNNENGSYLWSVKVVGTNFWLDAFDKMLNACKFCEENKLEYEVLK